MSPIVLGNPANISCNPSYCQILDTDSTLHFTLLRMQLIELIRSAMTDPNGDISAAIDFASTQLAPRAPQNPVFLKDLERTMALLIFPSDQLLQPLAELLDPKLRQDVAEKVNAAILRSQGIMPEARVKSIAKLRAWIENYAATSDSSRLRAIPKLGLGLTEGSQMGNGINADDASHT